MSNCFVTLSDGTLLDVMRGDLLFPYFGNWTAHVMLANAQSAPSGSCTLTCFSSSLTGFIYSSRSSDSEGRFYCMVVGGAGGLSSEIAPKGYNYQVNVSLPLNEILSSVGESISPFADPALLNTTIASWNRLRGSASLEISRLVDSIGGVWRVLPDGGVFIGTDSFSEAEDFDYIVLHEDPVHANVKLSLQTIGILPGNRFPISAYSGLSQRKIGACQYRFEEDETTMMVWFLEEGGIYTDPLHEGIEAFVKEVMRGVDYLAIYPCQVITQRLDGTVDIQPDSSKIPPMTSVPLRAPHPQIKLKIPPASRGNLVFEQGDPQKFAFHSYEMGEGGRKVSGVGDQVDLGFLVSVKNMTGAITSLTWNATAGDIPLGPGMIKTGWPNLEIGPEMS